MLFLFAYLFLIAQYAKPHWLLSLSKKERKRRKKLAELNKELEETRAEENKQTQTKHYKLTEIIKMVFTIYFRILKNDPTSKLLSAILEGLAE